MPAKTQSRVQTMKMKCAAKQRAKREKNMVFLPGGNQGEQKNRCPTKKEGS